MIYEEFVRHNPHSDYTFPLRPDSGTKTQTGLSRLFGDAVIEELHASSLPRAWTFCRDAN